MKYICSLPIFAKTSIQLSNSQKRQKMHIDDPLIEGVKDMAADSMSYLVYTDGNQSLDVVPKSQAFLRMFEAMGNPGGLALRNSVQLPLRTLQFKNPSTVVLNTNLVHRGGCILHQSSRKYKYNVRFHVNLKQQKKCKHEFNTTGYINKDFVELGVMLSEDGMTAISLEECLAK